MKIANYLKSNNEEKKQILTAILQKNSAFLIANQEKKLTKKQVKTIEFLYQKYQNGWPLPYLLNYQDFYKLKLKVNSQVLIPRPETELIIDLVLNQCQDLKNKKIDFLDIGTGSGAIILNLAHILKDYKNYQFFASDISKTSLELAKENAINFKLSKKIKFIHSDLLEKINLNSNYLIITANLPYLDDIQIKNPNLKKEPEIALYGGKGGLDIYRRLFTDLKKFKKVKYIKLFLEIDPAQKNKLEKIIKNNWPKSEIFKHYDLRKKLRFISINLNNQL